MKKVDAFDAPQESLLQCGNVSLDNAQEKGYESSLSPVISCCTGVVLVSIRGQFNGYL
jgi:hypothetical protein